jgi:hypothetical protein
MGKFVGDGSERGGSDAGQNEGQGGGVAAGRQRQTDEIWREIRSRSMRQQQQRRAGAHAAEAGTS